MDNHQSDLNDHVAAILSAIAPMKTGPGRLVVAIAGPPASGKTTLAKSLVATINLDTTIDLKSTLLPMDGFHLDNALLKPLGLLNRKGAPDTFDSDGFCRLVKRLQQRSEKIFYPIFDRSLDKSIAGAGVIESEIDVVVVEGNYLLMRAMPWNSVSSLYDLTVFITPSINVLEERLVERWLTHGFDKDEAYRKAHENDLPNAKTVIDNSTPGMIMFSEQ